MAISPPGASVLCSRAAAARAEAAAGSAPGAACAEPTCDPGRAGLIARINIARVTIAFTTAQVVVWTARWVAIHCPVPIRDQVSAEPSAHSH
jgi:hypothetical protein